MSFKWNEISTDSNITKKVFTANVRQLDDVQEFFVDYLKAYNCDDKCLDSLLVIIEELFVNVASYAYDDEGEVSFSCRVTDKPLCIHILIEDSGVPYNPLDRTEADAAQAVATLSVGGLGIIMVKKLCDGIDYTYENNHNKLYIRKVLENE